MERITTAEELQAVLRDRVMRHMGNFEIGCCIASSGLYGAAMDAALAPARSGPAAQVAFRAAWALESAYFTGRDEFRPYAPRFIDDFCKVKNPSVHRHYTKMMADMLKEGIARPDDAQASRIAETCFDRLIDPRTRVAVKIWAINILLALRPRVEWIAENLRAVLDDLSVDPSPAMTVTLRRLRLKAGL